MPATRHDHSRRRLCLSTREKILILKTNSFRRVVNNNIVLLRLSRARFAEFFERVKINLTRGYSNARKTEPSIFSCSILFFAAIAQR